jgi:pectin methylesterase-like acyl-CoA thioesterase
LGSDLLSKGLAVAVIVLFLGVNVISDVIGDNPTFVNIIYVDDDNTDGPWDGTPEHPYQHIQDAIDNASKGDTVYVYSGTYKECFRINKKIKLIGEDRDITIVDGEGPFPVVAIYADDVTIHGFTIQNSSSSSGWAVGINSDSNLGL